MYHGMDDANVGTNPINAEQMFMALDGLGKPAALYMYPYRRPRPASEGNHARPLGPLDDVARHLREEPEERDAASKHRNDDGTRRSWSVSNLKHVGTLTFLDLDTNDEGLVIVRCDEQKVALALSLISNGDTEVFMPLATARELIALLHEATSNTPSPNGANVNRPGV